MNLSFRSKLLLSHGLVVLAGSAVALLVVQRSLAERMEAQIDSRLAEQGRAVATWLERAGHPERLAPRLAGVVGARVTIVTRDGELVGDSENDAGTVDLSTAPELAAASRGAVGTSTRAGASGEQVRYVAVPGPRDWLVRIGLSIGEIDATRAQIRRQLIIGALVSLSVAAAFAMLLASALSRRLRAASALATQVARGDYAVGVIEAASDEVGVVSRTLADAAAELRETDRRRREFLANVAHEIRTPVTSISGYAQTLMGSEVDAETRDEFISVIHRNAKRIAQLVDDLLELEALSSGKAPPLVATDVELAPVVEHVLSTLRATTEGARARFEVEIEDGLRARGDDIAIERILLNLVDNACRHAGASPTIGIRGERTEDGIRILIRDDGPGIPPEQRRTLFERFTRKPAQGGQGRSGGLGLAIARELALAMGGQLRLGDSESAGAMFIVELPPVV